MSLQYSLFDLLQPPKPLAFPINSPSKPTNKVMILVKPDEAAAIRIARIMQELAAYLGFNGRLVRPELLHFTIHLIGRYSKVPQSIVDAVGECANTVRMRPFTVSLNMAKNFQGKNGIPLIVLCGDDGVLGLRTLHDTLQDALAKRFGLLRHRSFEPHMTMSYKAMRIADTLIEPISFVVREFVLVNSIQGMGQHVPLLTWKLCD